MRYHVARSAKAHAQPKSSNPCHDLAQTKAYRHYGAPWAARSFPLNPHCKVMLDTRCHTGNEFEENYQVLIHSDSILFFLIRL